MHDYGDIEIETIYTAFGKLLQNRNIDLETCKVQWTELKQHIVKKRRAELQTASRKVTKKQNRKTSPYFQYHDLWTTIISDPEMESRFHHILQLVKIMLVLPVHTAEVERGFSQMNLAKTKLRSSLQPESLASLLTVKLSKQDFRTYDPTNAIIKWSPMDALGKDERKYSHMARGKKRGEKKTPKASEACDG